MGLLLVWKFNSSVLSFQKILKLYIIVTTCDFCLACKCSFNSWL